MKRVTTTARQQEFLNLAISGLVVMLTGISGSPYSRRTCWQRSAGFLAAVIWIFFGVHFTRRHRLVGNQTMGILTPIVLIAATLTTIATMFLSGPIIGLSK